MGSLALYNIQTLDHELMVMGCHTPHVSFQAFIPPPPCLPSGFSSAVFVREFSATQLADSPKIYDEYGPIPRPPLCIDFTLSPGLLSSYDASRQAILSDLSVDRLAEAVVHTSLLDSDAFHPIFSIRRGDDNTITDFIVEPITHSTRHKLKKPFIQAVLEGQSQACQYEKCVSPLFAGLVFEAMAPLRFRGEVPLSLVPMVKQPRTRNRKISGNRPMPRPIPHRIEAEDRRRIRVVYVERVQKVLLWGFLRSKAIRSSDIRFFYVTDKVLYIFRFTTAQSPKIRGRMVHFQPMLDSTLQWLEWHLVFVTPPGNTIACSESSADGLEMFWNKVKLFSVEFNPKTMIGDPK